MMGWGRGVAAGGPTHIVADAHGIDRLEHRNDRRADGGSEQCALLEADVDDHACGGCDERTRIMSGSGGFRERDGAGGQVGMAHGVLGPRGALFKRLVMARRLTSAQRASSCRGCTKSVVRPLTSRRLH